MALTINWPFFNSLIGTDNMKNPASSEMVPIALFINAMWAYGMGELSELDSTLPENVIVCAIVVVDNNK